MNLNKEIELELKKREADFVHFVDISHLTDKQNKGFPHAVLIGIALSPEFIKMITELPDYVEKMVRTGKVKSDEYVEKEVQVDEIADWLEDHLSSTRFKAYSQSEKNVERTGFYNEKTKTTPLPHKTVAGLAGLGWIGKHNLLVTTEFGSAICMCTVLTDAPLNSEINSLQESLCEDCTICRDICSSGAIRGNTWKLDCHREDIINVFQCTQCLKCLVFCPWTQKYADTKGI